MDDDQIVRQDANAEHRLAAHTQGEILVIVPASVERQVVFDALLRQDRVTGGNIAEDRHLTAARGKLVDLDGLRRNGNGLQLLFERDGAALARALLNEPHLLQVLDMEMDRGGRLEPQRLADFTHGGGIAVFGDALGNVIVYALLHSGQFFHLVRPFQHLFEFMIPHFSRNATSVLGFYVNFAAFFCREIF